MARGASLTRAGLALVAFGMMGVGVFGADALDSASEVVKLWPEGAPGAKGTDPAKDVPTLSVFLPKTEAATGSAVIICPGGGYGMLAVDHEGKQVAEWLNSVGVAAFVLRYRLAPAYREPAMLNDVNRAVRTVRAGASKWGVDPGRIGLLGFSAGGHLASTGGTHFDAGKADADDPIERVSSRPDRLILVYPVITTTPPYAHMGSRKNLLGEDPSPDLLKFYSNDLQVTPETPPTFLAHTNGDTGVVPENSILFALGLRKAGVPLELHIFEKGKHGLGLGNGAKKFNVDPEPAFAAWPKLCETWLKGQGFLDKKAATATGDQSPRKPTSASE